MTLNIAGRPGGVTVNVKAAIGVGPMISSSNEGDCVLGTQSHVAIDRC